MKDTFKFSHRLRVRWAEVDRQGIVFNGHYLTYFDVAITEYWREIGLPYPEGVSGTGADLYVVKSSIEYHASAGYDNWLDIGVRVSRIGRSSMAFDVHIYRGDEHLITGEVIYVAADPATRKSVPVPARLCDAVCAFEPVDPRGNA
jgi:acyl-CoA thioester hydrolase